MIRAFENLMTIELNEYGFQIDTAWAYIALSWNLLGTIALAIVARRFYLKRKKNK